jgi:MFS family permease
MFQFNIVFGILVAFLSNYLIGSFVSENSWRWMLGVEAIPALVYTVMCFSIPRSPRWLIACRGDRESGAQVLKQINPELNDAQIAAMVDAIAKAAHMEQGRSTSTERMWTWRLRIPILLAFLVAFFNQLSGINAILYFAPRIFELAGLGKSAALLNSIGIGITNLMFTFIGLYLIDRLGRRTLLYIGSFGYIASLGACAWSFSAFAPQFQVANSAISVKSSMANLQEAISLTYQDEEDIKQLEQQLADAKQALVLATMAADYQGNAVAFAEDATPESTIVRADEALAEASERAGFGGTLVMLCIFAFIAAHAIGQGTVIWVLISEIFPSQHRAAGQSLGSFTHWIFAALLTTLFPWMIGTFAPAEVFGFFCFMMILQLVWVATTVPETNGVSLEEMEQTLGIVPQ